MKTVILMSAVLACLFTAEAQASSCREGQREIWNEDVYGSGEHTTPVHYVCRNGRFVKLFKDQRDYQPRHTPRFSCREGQREIWAEDVYGTGEHTTPVQYVCRNGRFVKVFPDHRDHQPKFRGHRGCREGQKEMFLEDDGSGDHMRQVHYVCRNGRFVKRW